MHYNHHDDLISDWPLSYVIHSLRRYRVQVFAMLDWGDPFDWAKEIWKRGLIWSQLVMRREGGSILERENNLSSFLQCCKLSQHGGWCGYDEINEVGSLLIVGSGEQSGDHDDSMKRGRKQQLACCRQRWTKRRVVVGGESPSIVGESPRIGKQGVTDHWWVTSRQGRRDADGWWWDFRDESSTVGGMSVNKERLEWGNHRHCCSRWKDTILEWKRRNFILLIAYSLYSVSLFIYKVKYNQINLINWWHCQISFVR